MLDIRTFGAVGDGRTMNTAAIQAAIDQAGTARETVLIPAGVYLTGTLNLHGVSLHLDAGAVLKGSESMDDYPAQDYVHNEMGPLRALIVCRDADDVTIDGFGAIDLSGEQFYDPSFNVPPSRVPFTPEQEKECTHPIGARPNQCLFFHNGKNITLRGIKVVDAPCWTLSFNECENVKVLDMTINTSLNVPNGDGMHFCSCKGVIVSGCHITTGDDCIALSSITNWHKPCEDVIITGCVLKSCSKAIVIGYIYSLVRNVAITNCIIRESNRGLCFMCTSNGGVVENVRVSNCLIDTRIRAGNWWGNGEPIFLMAVRHDFHLPPDQNPKRETAYAMRGIHIDGVICTGENAIGVVGENGNIRDVELRNIDYTRKPSQNLPLKGACFDLAPGCTEIAVPESCGLMVTGADVKLENVNTHEWEQRIY